MVAVVCSLGARFGGSARGGLPGSPVFPCLVASRMRLAHLGHAEDPLEWIDIPSAPAGRAPVFESIATQEPRDCFISHTSEGKDAIARPLAEALTSAATAFRSTSTNLYWRQVFARRLTREWRLLGSE